MAGSHVAPMDWQYPSSTTDHPFGSEESYSTAPCWNVVQQGHYDLRAMATAPLEMPMPYQNTTTSTKAKRKRKALTMSAEKWEPCKMLIKELYVDKRKTLKDVRMIVNEEFKMSATERQYKVQIEKWNLERNVKKHERRAIVKKVSYRKQILGKETGLIRVRGHKETEKLERWMREMGIQMAHDCMGTSPPPDTPSEVSIYTTSHPGSPSLLSPSPKLSLGDFSISLDHRGESTALIPNLCRYAHQLDQSLFCEEKVARTLLEGCKTILNFAASEPSRPYSKDAPWSDWLGYFNWNESALTDIRHLDASVRSAQNSKPDQTLNVFVASALRGTPAATPRSLVAHSLKRTSWLTPYGRADASFWFTPRNSICSAAGSSDERTAGELVWAQVTIVPSQATSPFRIEFEFDILNSYSNHCLDAIRVSYKPIVPRDARILHIAERGTVKELREALETGTANLNAHDPDGRSLLSYALKGRNLDMCKFLLSEGADPNAYEPDDIGIIKPVIDVHLTFFLEYYADDEIQIQHTCARILLEAGADFSLEDEYGESVFEGNLAYFARPTLEAILNLGSPYLSSTKTIAYDAEEISTLMAVTRGFHNWDPIDAAENTVVFIERGADVLFRDEAGNTVLQYLFNYPFKKIFRKGFFILGQHRIYHDTNKLRQCIEVLLILIAAGADVHAINTKGETISHVAEKNGWAQIWIRALEFCGYDSQFVLDHSKGVQRTSNESKQESNLMAFDRLCQLRRDRGSILHKWVSEMVVDMLEMDEKSAKNYLKYGSDTDEWESDIDELESDADELKMDKTIVEKAVEVRGFAMEFENDTEEIEIDRWLADGIVDVGENTLTGEHGFTEENNMAMDLGKDQQTQEWAMQWQNWL